MLATKCCCPRCNQDTVDTFVTLQPQPQEYAGYCRLIVSRPGIAVSHRYFSSLHLFLCHQLFSEKWLGLRAAVRRVTLETDTSGAGVWCLQSWSGPSLQFDADHELSHEPRRGQHHMCHDDWHEPQSQQRLFASKRMCLSVGTRIIRLDRGYSTQCSCNLDRLWPGDAALLFVLYHLFSKHIKGKAEIKPRVLQRKDFRIWRNTEYVVNILNENHDIAIAMSSSRAVPVLGLNILQGWLEVFKYLNQWHWPGWEYLNI